MAFLLECHKRVSVRWWGWSSFYGYYYLWLMVQSFQSMCLAAKFLACFNLWNPNPWFTTLSNTTSTLVRPFHLGVSPPRCGSVYYIGSVMCLENTNLCKKLFADSWPLHGIHMTGCFTLISFWLGMKTLCRPVPLFHWLIEGANQFCF